MDGEAPAQGAGTGTGAPAAAPPVGAGEAAAAAGAAAAPGEGGKGGEGGEGKTATESLFSHLENPNSPAAPKPVAKTGDGGVTNETVVEGGGEGGEAGTGKTGEGGEAGTVAETTVEVRGKAYDLGGVHTLYQESSREGVRLNNTLGIQEDRVVALELEIAELEAKGTDVPFGEKTDEQLEAMSSLEQNKYLHAKSEHERNAAAGKTAAEGKKAAYEKFVTDRKEFIIDKMHQMADSPRYKDYRELVPVMKEVEAIAPFVMGEKNTPLILYYAALGMQKWRADHAGEEATAGAEAAAGASAQAGAARVQAPGKPGTAQGGGTALDPDSDEAVGAKILAANRPNILAGLGQD